MNFLQRWFARHRPWLRKKPLGSCAEAETWLQNTAMKDYRRNKELEDARERQRRLQDELMVMTRDNHDV